MPDIEDDLFPLGMVNNLLTYFDDKFDGNKQTIRRQVSDIIINRTKKINK